VAFEPTGTRGGCWVSFPRTRGVRI